MRMSRADGIECFLWVFRVVILVMVWTKKGRAYLEEHICCVSVDQTRRTLKFSTNHLNGRVSRIGDFTRRGRWCVPID